MRGSVRHVLAWGQHDIDRHEIDVPLLKYLEGV